MPYADLEISDEIVSFDPRTLARRPVRKQDVVERFRLCGNRRAVRLVEAMPDRDGLLDPDAVDERLVRVHCEMQRVSEEFQHGLRVTEFLRPLLAALREHGVAGPIRIVDVGCGTGYVLRWLAAESALPDDVELVGADHHGALIEEARRLAAAESLRVSFVVANAFELEKPGTVFLTTGVVHHFRGDDLVSFFRQHDRPETMAFVHFDFQPSPLAIPGSWLFHAVRMRDPLAKHDGVVSALRAHTAETLRAAARAATSSFRTAMYSTRLWFLPVPRAFHALVGVRAGVEDSLTRALGSRARRLSRWQ